MPKMLATAASISAALELDTPLGEAACTTMGKVVVAAGATAGAGAGTPASQKTITYDTQIHQRMKGMQDTAYRQVVRPICCNQTSGKGRGGGRGRGETA